MDEQFGIAVGLLTVVGYIPILLHDLFSGLDVHAQPAATDNPFDLHFSLRNPNLLFAMNELEVVCTHGQLVVEGERIDEGYNMRRLRTPDTIKPGATLRASCIFTSGAAVYKAAEMQLRVSYRILFWLRSTTAYFTWTDATRQWLRSGAGSATMWPMEHRTLL